MPHQHRWITVTSTLREHYLVKIPNGASPEEVKRLFMEEGHTCEKPNQHDTEEEGLELDTVTASDIAAYGERAITLGDGG